MNRAAGRLQRGAPPTVRPASTSNRPAAPARSGDACACGGACPRCAAFGRDRPRGAEAAPGASAAAAGPEWTLVDGFPMGAMYCFCDGQVEKEIAWVARMADIFRACRREAAPNARAEAAVACKEAKLAEAGLRTTLAGSVGASGAMEVDEWAGPCGAIFRHGVLLHESVHQDYVAHGDSQTMPANGSDQEKKRDLAEVGAREYAANEVKAYGRERDFLERVLTFLVTRCSAGQRADTPVESYRRSCGVLGLEMGLDWAEGTTWGRQEVEDAWPGLRGKCWWYLGGPDGGYNCFGHCLRGEGPPQVLEPGLQTTADYDAFLAARGFVPVASPARPGDIAVFSGAHVACRSSRDFAGTPLWESKLSREAPLILHELRDIEGAAFGQVVAFYTHAGA